MEYVHIKRNIENASKFAHRKHNLQRSIVNRATVVYKVDIHSKQVHTSTQQTISTNKKIAQSISLQ